MRFLSFILCAVLSLFLVSCDQGAGDDVRHPFYIKGVKLKGNAKFPESAKAFEEYLRVNPYSAKAHYELASLYDESLGDPFMAIYHYRKFVELDPDNSERKKVETWIQAKEKDYCSQLKAKYPDDDTRRQLEVLKEREKRYVLHLTQLRNENSYLKSQLGQKLNPQMTSEPPVQIQPLQAQDVSLQKTAPSPGPAPVPAEMKKKEIPEFYVVKSGDTLSRISKDIYGDIKYFKMIFDANKDVLTSENLQIGQKLRLPKLPEKPQD